MPASFSWEARNVNKNTNFCAHHAAQLAAAKNAGYIGLVVFPFWYVIDVHTHTHQKKNCLIIDMVYLRGFI
jgi:hypothetical protein